VNLNLSHCPSILADHNPSSLPVSSDDTRAVISLLLSPELSVLQSAASIVQHLSVNGEVSSTQVSRTSLNPLRNASARFREALLKADIWENLLRRSESGPLVPDMLEHLAKHR
jgi:hypothetical protein